MRQVEYEPTDHSPNPFTGWGLVLLEKIIYNLAAPATLYRPSGADYIDDVEMQAGRTKSLCYTVLDGVEELRVTIAWTDPATSPFLVNNIDLAVHHLESHSFWAGNHLRLAGAGSADIFDTENPVERIVIPNPKEGTYVVSIIGVDITPEEPQLVAAVVTTHRGPALQAMECPMPTPLCPRKCSGHGTCQGNGKCACDWPFVGAACDGAMPLLRPQQSLNVTTPSMQMTLVGVDLQSQPALLWRINSTGSYRICDLNGLGQDRVPAWDDCAPGKKDEWFPSSTIAVVVSTGGVYGSAQTFTLCTRLIDDYVFTMEQGEFSQSPLACPRQNRKKCNNGARGRERERKRDRERKRKIDACTFPSGIRCRKQKKG